MRPVMARPADPNARASLIAAARAEFVRKGLRGARIEDITAACGLSKGAFYLHFESKEALFRELVDAFMSGTDSAVSERMGRMQRFFNEHGRPEARDVTARGERYQRLVELETEMDRVMLEIMWSNRDVLDVLVRGSQGTEFESLVWTLLNAEVERVASDFQRMVGPCSGLACATDPVDPQLFGSLVVGTYMLLGMRMSHMPEKPDLAYWAANLQRLVREGCMPRPQLDAPPAAVPARASRAVSKPSQRRASQARALPARRNPRKSP